MPLTRPKIWDVDTDIGFFKDPVTVLHQGSTSANNDVGFLFNRANGLVSNVALVWQESSKSIIHVLTNDSGVIDSNISVTSYANVTIGNVLMIANAGLYVNGSLGTPGQVLASDGAKVYWTSSTFPGGYVANQSTFGGNLVANSGTTSTSVTTGALVVVGGTGISGELYIQNTGDVSANIGAYQTWANTSITSLYTSANANTAAYLTTYTGNIQAGNITVTGNINATSNVFANLLYVASGLRWSGNGLAISTGGGGTSLIYTAATTPPPSGNVTGDQWYNTSTDILYEYINDGTTSYWVDIQSLGTTGNITLMSDATLAGNIVVGVDTRYSIGAASGYLRNLYTSNLFANTGTISGNLTTGNVTTGIITATGNVNAANLTTSGIATVSGNITSGNIVTGIITATGNVNAANLTTAGNVVAAYHIGDGSKLTNTFTTGKAIAMSIVFGG